VATQPSRTRDDVVLQQPEDLRVVIKVPHSENACAGAASAYVLRRIAYRAGAYAPGIQEHLFFELATGAGQTLESVQGWFRDRVGELQVIGYRFQARRVAERTPGIAAWVKEGGGYRGALLPTTYRRLHPGSDVSDESISYAVGLVIDRVDGASKDDLVLVDPWPGPSTPDRVPVPAALDAAHRDRAYQAIIFYWAGWA